jgi:hypothetical protein
MILQQLQQVLEEQKQNNPTPPVVEEPTGRVANTEIVVNKIA